jgi:hypothetical protein
MWIPWLYGGSNATTAVAAARGAGDLSQEVLPHLAGPTGSEVEVRIEIDPKIPDGAPDHVVRTASENCWTPEFTSSGFEAESAHTHSANDQPRLSFNKRQLSFRGVDPLIFQIDGFGTETAILLADPNMLAADRV